MDSKLGAIRVLTVLLLAGSITACGASAKNALRTSESPGAIPDKVHAKNLSEAVRVFHALPLEHKQRQALRAGILKEFVKKVPKGHSEEDYEHAIQVFRAMTDLYQGSELQPGGVAPEVGVAAKKVIELGARMGDESRVLSAWLALSLVGKANGEPGGSAADAKQQYRKVAKWGHDVRATIADPIRRLTGLIEVWEEHAELTPAPQVIEYVSRLHIQRREAARNQMSQGEGFGPSSLMWQNGGASALSAIVLRTPLDIASVYLQEGDVTGAADAIERMPELSKGDEQVVDVLRTSAEASDTGRSSLYELAETFRPTRPAVALGICRAGKRHAPSDIRFPVCLARIAARQSRFNDATEWYMHAIDIAPKERGLYDEALSTLSQLIELDLMETNLAEARTLAAKTERILQARKERWPNASSPVTAEQIQLLLGMLEMNAGNLEAAWGRLKASINLKPNEAAFLQLGTLSLRTGRYEHAIRYLKQALRLMPKSDTARLSKRAEALEQLGDALRQTHRDIEADKAYRSALKTWDALGSGVKGAGMAAVHLREGILLDRLDNHEDAVEAFRKAMTVAPGWRDAYASILSHLVVTRPDADLAHEVFRKAQRHLTLAPEWKVYFALWVSTVSGLAGQPTDEDVQSILSALSEEPPWWGRLARFGSGELGYSELVRAASGLGQRTEAHFYEGARRLAKGDMNGAEELFKRVLDTRMVNFYEFAMAQELLGATR